MSGTALVFIGSLAGIIILIAISALLRLGGAPVIADDNEALALAEDAVCGFGAVQAARDAGGRGALVRGADGRIILLAPHGTHFAARLLDAQSRARTDGPVLTVTTGEKLFRAVALDLGPAAGMWAQRIAGLSGAASTDAAFAAGTVAAGGAHHA